MSSLECPLAALHTESEDLEKRYYEGRYRGLPILRSE
jgi:hypothetical protein